MVELKKEKQLNKYIQAIGLKTYKNTFCYKTTVFIRNTPLRSVYSFWRRDEPQLM